MKKWIIILLSFIATLAYSGEICDNEDGIGTFIGGEDPFPWGRVVDLPPSLGGIWEVIQTDDGAYIVINEENDELSGKPKIRIHLLNPCSLTVMASGTAYAREDTLVTTLIYPGSNMRVKLQLQAFLTKSNRGEEGVEVVLMVMNSSREMKIDKYFPVRKLSIGELVEKCVE